MIEPSQFQKHGCDSKSLKKLFAPEGKKAKRSEDIESLVTLLRDRIKDGRTRALNDYRIWAAVDLAYDCPFEAETPTIVRHIISQCRGDNPEAEMQNLLGAVKSWGLCQSDLFCRVEDKGSPGGYMLGLNKPLFFGVVIPIMRGYLNIRLSKLYNDRNKNPLFDYQPQHDTEADRIACEIVTSVVQGMNLEFNYHKDLRQNFLNALLYSASFQFPVEPWYTEKQIGADGKDEIRIEGVRYVQPHITRTGCDLQYPPSTLNTDTGCTFAFYWSIGRWGDVERDDRLWNLDQVGYGTNWLDGKAPYANYFRQAYPCTMSLPATTPRKGTSDREAQAAIYNQNDYDKAVFLTYVFMKLTPKDWGMGTYPHPMWFKFSVASDDTIVYAEPFSYSPVKYCPYDADMNRGRNTSLALELIPSQDEIGNLVNQINTTIKRNLANIIFVDDKQVNFKLVEQLMARTNWQHGGINFVPFDAFKDRIAASGRDVPKGNCFQEVKLAYANTAEQFQSLAMWLNLTERLIGISAQEVGSAASHQQGNKEIALIAGSSTNRVQYTGNFFDEFIYAWKKQLAEAIRAHKSRECIAEVLTGTPNLDAHLTALGFKPDGKTAGGKKTLVRGKKDSLKFENFASSQNAPDVEADKESGTAMLTALGSLNNNQRLAAVLDIKSQIDLWELAAKKMGAGKKFDLKIDDKALTGEQLKAAIDEVAKIVSQTVGQEIGKPAANALAEQEKKIELTEQQLTQLAQIVAKLKLQMNEVMTAAQGAAPLQPPTALDANPITAQAPLSVPAEVPPGMVG